MSMSYETALVTGASAGLGEEFATQLAPRMDRVVLVARRGERLSEISQELTSRFGIEVLVVTADISQSAECERVYREVTAKGWKVDLLVNNAGLGCLLYTSPSPRDRG